MVARGAGIPARSLADFGALLRFLRRGAQLTQRDLGIAVGYSEAQISRLEQGKRLPDPAVVAALFVPALGLSGDPELANRLHSLAEASRATGHDAGTHADDLVAIPAGPQPRVDRVTAKGRLRDRLEAGGHVLICGAPGTGKTTLAADLARDLARTIPVCWVTLTQGITTPAEAVVRRLARFLDRHDQEVVTPLLDPGRLDRPLPRHEQMYLLSTALNRSGALICLDNTHLLAGETETRAIVEYLASSTPTKWLCVSREEFPLATFQPFHVTGLTAAEAHALIDQLAAGMLSAQHAERLIERTDGSPMMIRLALGQIDTRQSDPGTLVERLEAQSGVAAYLLEATLAGLSQPARLLTALLAVFRHPVDLLHEGLIEQGQVVEGPYDVIAGIEELRRRQLVDHAARATLHPLVHDHCYAELAGSAARRRRLHRLAAAHCEQALADPLEASWHYARASDTGHAAELLVASAADLTASGRSARAADHAADLLATGVLAAEMARRLHAVRGDLLLHTERAAEAEQAYRAALAASTSPAPRAEIAWRLAQCLLQRSQVHEALELCVTASEDLEEAARLPRAELATVKSQAHLMLSEFDEAVASASQACGLAEGGEASSVRCRAYGVLGIVARLRGHPEEATVLLRDALAAARAARHQDMAGRALFNLGAIAHENGEMDQAERLYSEALAEMRPIGDIYGIARVLNSLGNIRYHGGAADEALELLSESVAIRRRLGDLQGAANSEHSYAHVLLALGRTVEARALLAAVLEATAGLGERRSRGHFLDSIAMIALVDGDLAAADGYLEEADAIATEIGEPILVANVIVHRAMACLAADDVVGATRLADQWEVELAAPGRIALDRLAASACVALANADATSATRYAAELADRATASGMTLEADAARRVMAAAAAVRAGAPLPQAAGYPRLIWVASGPEGSGTGQNLATATATSSLAR